MEHWLVDADEGGLVTEPVVFVSRFDAKQEMYQVHARELLKKGAACSRAR